MKVRQSSVSISGKSSLSLFQNMLRLLIWNMHIIIKTVINRMHAHSNHPVLPTPLACATSIIWLKIRVAHCCYLCCFSLSPLSRRLQHSGSGSTVCAPQSLLLRCFVYNIARASTLCRRRFCVCYFRLVRLFFRSAFILVTYSDKASSVPNWICICN